MATCSRDARYLCLARQVSAARQVSGIGQGRQLLAVDKAASRELLGEDPVLVAARDILGDGQIVRLQAQAPDATRIAGRQVAPPISPGDVLKRRILKDEITQEKLAFAMRVSRISVNQIVNGRRSITAEMALRLARVIGTTPFFWLNLQRDVDLYEAKRKVGKDVERLTVLRAAPTEAELFADAKET
jgi:addiction module HigA family antidote